MTNELGIRLYRYIANSAPVIYSNVEVSCTSFTAWTLLRMCMYYTKPEFFFCSYYGIPVYNTV